MSCLSRCPYFRESAFRGSSVFFLASLVLLIGFLSCAASVMHYSTMLINRTHQVWFSEEAETIFQIAANLIKDRLLEAFE